MRSRHQPRCLAAATVVAIVALTTACSARNAPSSTSPVDSAVFDPNESAPQVSTSVGAAAPDITIENTASGNTASSNTASESSADTPTTNNTGTVDGDGPEIESTGDFATLTGVCGPGDATGATARGVTDTTITVGTGADVQNPFIPGLGAGFFAAAAAFSEWCNAAGGINGREIIVNEHDGGLFNAGAAVVEACETDFMLVGNGFAQDDQTPEPRLGCELGQIPAYQNSAAASGSGLQVQPLPIPLDEWFVGGYRAVEAEFPGSLDAAGILGSAVPTVERNNTGAAAGIESLGGTVAAVQRVPPGNVDNWRPYAEALKQAGVTFLVPGAAAIGAMSPFGQAMNAAGFEPAAMVLDSSAYKPVNYLALNDVDLPPFYLAIQFWPESLADRSPAATQAIDMLAAVDDEAPYDFEYVQGLNAWILWAVASTACGSDLTTQCVLDNAGAQQGWTAGGLVPPSDLSATELNMNTCFLMVRATPEGWVYEEEMTAPNTEAFNCSPDNVATVNI